MSEIEPNEEQQPSADDRTEWRAPALERLSMRATQTATVNLSSNDAQTNYS